MKKYFFLTAIAAFALCSCVKDEPDGLWDKTKITFESPVISSLTKANHFGEVTNPYPTDEHFSVYAVYTADNYSTSTADDDIFTYMNNVETAYARTSATDTENPNGWAPEAVTGGHAYYWPKHGYLTFAAYSPTSAGTNGSMTWDVKNGFKLTGFTVPATPAQQYDLMFSKLSANNQRGSSGIQGTSTYDGVPIVFQHALSSIKFVMGDLSDEYDNNIDINITDITINGAYSKGDFTQNMSDGSSAGTWDKCSEPVGSYTVYDEDVTTTVNGYLNNYDVILLPQTLNDNNGHDVKATVTFTMKHKDGSNSSLEAITQTVTVSLSGLSYTVNNQTTNITAWEAGKRYIYTIGFEFDKIYFAPSVEEWVDRNVTGPSID